MSNSRVSVEGEGVDARASIRRAGVASSCKEKVSKAGGGGGDNGHAKEERRYHLASERLRSIEV